MNLRFHMVTPKKSARKSLTVTIDGRCVALHGHRTECGCTLIGSMTARVGD
ncbi:PAAR domain-containing protein [Burkholderia pseudomultivorans]|uniref:PAAR domain-containing protein n=1 Tax=Burkholderia pseudomultivorans TaxID=1207504 RepID=UPI0018906509|nr:PAAR domain-containing protein [Burkholderia pseudomultivorans]MBF5011249.1 PAAR domain-containing protein [Burkholderia pseudomultivorans]